MARLLAAIAVFLSVAVSAYSQEKVVVKGVITSAEDGLHQDFGEDGEAETYD